MRTGRHKKLLTIAYRFRMESDAFSAAGPAPGQIEMAAFLFVVIGAVFFLLMVVLLLCFCCRRWSAARPMDLSTALEIPSHGAAGVTNLIPPLFYTEGLRDPLMQEDLRDHLRGVEPPAPARLPAPAIL
jgi:hypothetical protein